MEKKINDFKHKIGMNCLSTSLRDIVEYNGYDMDEDLCMGLSGAFSFWYSKCPEFMQATGVGNNIFEEFAAITKVQHHYIQLEDNDKAWKVSCNYIDNDIPVLLDVEIAAYAEFFSTSQSAKQKIINIRNTINFRVGGHVSCMVGYDDDNVFLDENLMYKTITVPINSLKEARNPIDIEFVPPKNGMHVFYFPEKLPDMDYMIDIAIVRAINNMELSYNKPKYCYGGLTYDCSGLKAIDKMFDDIQEVYLIKDNEKITQLNALLQILNRWGGNEVNRASYSRFLFKAAQLKKNENLKKAAEQYRDASKQWKTFLREMENNPVNNVDSNNEFIEKNRNILMEKEKRALDYLHKATKY